MQFGEGAILDLNAAPNLRLDILQSNLALALGLFLGAYVGAWMALKLSPETLRRTFAVFLGIVAIRMWLGA